MDLLSKVWLNSENAKMSDALDKIQGLVEQNICLLSQESDLISYNQLHNILMSVCFLKKRNNKLKIKAELLQTNDKNVFWKNNNNNNNKKQKQTAETESVKSKEISKEVFSTASKQKKAFLIWPFVSKTITEGQRVQTNYLGVLEAGIAVNLELEQHDLLEVSN